MHSSSQCHKDKPLNVCRIVHVHVHVFVFCCTRSYRFAKAALWCWSFRFFCNNHWHKCLYSRVLWRYSSELRPRLLPQPWLHLLALFAILCIKPPSACGFCYILLCLLYLSVACVRIVQDALCFGHLWPTTAMLKLHQFQQANSSFHTTAFASAYLSATGIPVAVADNEIAAPQFVTIAILRSKPCGMALLYWICVDACIFTSALFCIIGRFGAGKQRKVMALAHSRFCLPG